jgi:hypothetical protein
MTGKTTPRPHSKADPTRDDRLKAALKENMAKRKAQARAKAGANGARADKTGQTTDNAEE